MNIHLDALIAAGYTSGSQIARRLTEGWIATNMYCPRCGNSHVDQCRNNAPVSDFACPACGNVLELKSKKGSLGNKIADGAFRTMNDRITSDTNPDFMFLGYSLTDMIVRDLTVIPKHFFVPAIIEKRAPLAPNARRAGWVGCNLLLSRIPHQGHIVVIKDGQILPQKQVVEKLNRANALATGKCETRGWLFEVLNCVNAIQNDVFTLSEMYDLKARWRRHIRTITIFRRKYASSCNFCGMPDILNFLIRESTGRYVNGYRRFLCMPKGLAIIIKRNFSSPAY